MLGDCLVMQKIADLTAVLQTFHMKGKSQQEEKTKWKENTWKKKDYLATVITAALK